MNSKHDAATGGLGGKHVTSIGGQSRRDSAYYGAAAGSFRDGGVTGGVDHRRGGEQMRRCVSWPQAALPCDV